MLLILPLSGAAAQAGAKGAADSRGLLPPTRAWAAQVSPTEFTLVWRGVPSATGYEVLVRNAQGQLIRLGLLSASGSRFTVPLARLTARGVLLDGVQFAVRALRGATEGPLTMFNPVSSAKQVTPKALVAPTNVAAHETAPSVVTVTWDAVEGATAYAIGRAAGPSGFQRFCDICPSEAVLVDTVPTAGMHYVYSITALTPGGRSRPAVTGRIEVLGTHAGGAAGVPGGSPVGPAGGVAAPDPKGLAAGITVTPRVSGGARGSLANIVLRLARRALDQVTGQVTVVMRQVCDGPWIVVREVSLAQPVVEVEDAVEGIDAQCGTGKRSVRYQVRVSNAKGLVANSPTGEVEVPTTVASADTTATPEPAATNPPATPGNRRMASTSTGRRTLMWDAVPGATSYRIERIAGAKGAWTVVHELPGTATSWVDTAKVDGTPQYRITAVNRAGHSASGSFR